MDFLYRDDPIIACSTGAESNSAIAVIRLSGFKDLSFLDDCLSIPSDKIKSRYAHYCSLFDGEEKIDDLVLTYFQGPHTYNGENILELSVHGNHLIIEKVISFFVSKKAFKRAYPGEFSYRALKNKKMSLSQVEGLDLILNANSSFALEQGNSLLAGELKEAYKALYGSFLKHKSALELSIDFLDDVGEEESQRQLKSSFEEFEKSVESLYSRCTHSANLLKPEICLAGKPNSGKSSLFNSLLKKDRAIVSAIEGTTRDYISESLNIHNNFYSLVDTAGIRETKDQIESIGIDSTLKILESAFFKVLVLNPLESFEKDFKDYDLVILTHADMGKNEDFGPIEPGKFFGPIGADFKSFGPIEPDYSGGPIGPVFISVDARNLSKNDISLFSSIISSKFSYLSDSNPIILDRHKDLISELLSKTSLYKQIVFKSNDISIVSSELNIVGHCISELIGIVSPDDVLKNIFDNFCIGK